MKKHELAIRSPIIMQTFSLDGLFLLLSAGAPPTGMNRNVHGGSVLLDGSPECSYYRPQWDNGQQTTTHTHVWVVCSSLYEAGGGRPSIACSPVSNDVKMDRKWCTATTALHSPVDWPLNEPLYKLFFFGCYFCNICVLKDFVDLTPFLWFPESRVCGLKKNKKEGPIV